MQRQKCGLFLAENCVFGVIRNDLIKNRLVGLRDSILSEKLQSDDKLILETALSPNSVIETSQLTHNSKEIAGLKFCVSKTIGLVHHTMPCLCWAKHRGGNKNW